MSFSTSACNSAEQATLTQVRSATTPAQVVSAFHSFQKHYEQTLLSCKSTKDPSGVVLRTAAIATSLLRHARIASSNTLKPLEIRPDVLARMVVRDLVRMYECCGLPADNVWEFLRLLKAEAQLIRFQFRHHAMAQLKRLTQGATWDLALVSQCVRELPPPFDMNPARYVRYVEEDSIREMMSSGTLPVVEDVSLKSTVSAKDPNSLCRIQTPVRSTRCHHLQCFDLMCFLAVLQRSAKSAFADDRYAPSAIVAPCPVCATKLSVTELYVDVLQAAALATSPQVVSLVIDRQTGGISAVLGAVDVSDAVEEVDVERASKRSRDDSDFTIEGIALNDH